MDTFIVRPDADSGLVACMDVDAPDEPLNLLVAGIRVSGNRLQGDRVHNQLYTLPDRPTSLAIVADGSMPQLVETAAAWFERILRRPIARHEWTRFGRVYAYEYLFSDTLEGLCQMYDDSLAPRGLRKSLIRSGHVYGKGWVQVRGIGKPDRITHVRGHLS